MREFAKIAMVGVLALLAACLEGGAISFGTACVLTAIALPASIMIAK